MTCGQVLEKWRQSEKIKIEESDMTARKKRRALNEWTQDFHHFSIASNVAKSKRKIVISIILVMIVV